MKNYNYKFFIMLFKHPIARTANLALVKSTNRLAVSVILEIFHRSR